MDFSIFSISGSALTAQAQRMNVSASNLANADSVTSTSDTAYRAKQVIFRVDDVSGLGVGGVNVTEVIDDPMPMHLVYDPHHPLADAHGYIQKPNVDPVAEMINTLSAARSYQANVEVINTAKSLMLKTLALGQ